MAKRLDISQYRITAIEPITWGSVPQNLAVDGKVAYKLACFSCGANPATHRARMNHEGVDLNLCLCLGCIQGIESLRQA